MALSSSSLTIPTFFLGGEKTALGGGGLGKKKRRNRETIQQQEKGKEAEDLIGQVVGHFME